MGSSGLHHNTSRANVSNLCRLCMKLPVQSYAGWLWLWNISSKMIWHQISSHILPSYFAQIWYTKKSPPTPKRAAASDNLQVQYPHDRLRTWSFCHLYGAVYLQMRLLPRKVVQVQVLLSLSLQTFQRFSKSEPQLNELSVLPMYSQNADSSSRLPSPYWKLETWNLSIIWEVRSGIS